MNLPWRLIIQGLMKSSCVIKIKIFPKTIMGVPHRHIFMDVNIIIFYRPPQTLGKNIIQVPASPVHADPDFIIQQHLREFQ